MLKKFSAESSHRWSGVQLSIQTLCLTEISCDCWGHMWVVWWTFHKQSQPDHAQPLSSMQVTLCCWPVSSLLHQLRSKLPKLYPAQWPRPRQYWLQVPAVLCFPQPVSHPGQTSPAEAPWAQQGPEHRRVVCHGVPYGGFPWCFLLCNGSCSALRNKRIQVRDVSQWHNCLPGSEKSWVWFPVLSKINKRVLLVSSLSTSYCLTQRIHFLPQKC